MRNPNKSGNGMFAPSTLSEAHIRQMADEGMTRGQIAARLGVDPKTLRRALIEYGIDPVRCNPGVGPKPPAISLALFSVWR